MDSDAQQCNLHSATRRGLVGSQTYHLGSKAREAEFVEALPDLGLEHPVRFSKSWDPAATLKQNHDHAEVPKKWNRESEGSSCPYFEPSPDHPLPDRTAPFAQMVQSVQVDVCV